jgi:hypothetical protein
MTTSHETLLTELRITVERDHRMRRRHLCVATCGDRGDARWRRHSGCCYAGSDLGFSCEYQLIDEVRARDERRLRGKDDSIDAIRAGRTALASETLALPTPADNPQVAVAVLLEKQANGFGGAVAAPIAKAVLQGLLSG